MRLEGTLDAFSLPDVFQLLSYTKKTGALHLRRGAEHGVVHLRDGSVTGARSDAGQQALGRRLLGAGLIDDQALEHAAATVAAHPGTGLGRALAELGGLDEAQLRELAAEQATDAVYDLLGWSDGEFAFIMDEPDPDDLGAFLAVEDVVSEGRRRQLAWDAAGAPAARDVVWLAPGPATDPVLTREEWSLLSLVDGARTVAELVELAGRGHYVTVVSLGALVARGLVGTGEPQQGAGSVARRQELLATLERGPARSRPAAAAPSSPAHQQPAPAFAARPPAIPERLEPFSPPRQPQYAEPAWASSHGTVGIVQGAHALAPQLDGEAAPAASAYIDRDPSVNKSLLLRLIAGVRGL